MTIDFSRIAPFLKNPLILIGFGLFIFFGICQLLITTKILPPLDAQAGGALLSKIVNYGFILSVLLIPLGLFSQWRRNSSAQKNRFSGDIAGNKNEVQQRTVARPEGESQNDFKGDIRGDGNTIRQSIRESD